MPSMNDDAGEQNFVMPFGEHLEELRARIILSMIAPVLIAIPCLIFGNHILQLFLRPVQWALASEHLPFRLQTLSPIEAFMSYLKISIVAAIVFSAPVIMYQLWRFVAPGLRESERRFARLLVPFSAILIIVRILFLYTVALPLSLRMLVRFSKNLDMGPALVHIEQKPTDTNTEPAPDQTDQPETLVGHIPVLDHQPWNMKAGEMYFDTNMNQLRIMLADGTVLGSDFMADVGLNQQFQLKSYINLVLGLILAFSIAFQMPLVILLLGWVHIINVEWLSKNRKYAILAIFIIGAVLTPPDVVSQIALAVPLYFLYELGILLLRIFPTPKRSREESKN